MVCEGAEAGGVNVDGTGGMGIGVVGDGVVVGEGGGWGGSAGRRLGAGVVGE